MILLQQICPLATMNNEQKNFKMIGIKRERYMKQNFDLCLNFMCKASDVG